MNNVIGTTGNNMWTRKKIAAFRQISAVMKGAQTSILQKSAEISMPVPARPVEALCDADLEDMLAFDYKGG